MWPLQRENILTATELLRAGKAGATVERYSARKKHEGLTPTTVWPEPPRSALVRYS